MLGRLALNTWFSYLGILNSGITLSLAWIYFFFSLLLGSPASASSIPVSSNSVFSLSEALRAIEFVADPTALATILSGEGVKSCPLGRQSSLAQRVLVRGSKGGTTQKGQVMRRM